ncbi:MAG: GNAT family N-acetyltransferase [Actinobacteria bacterium]|nr:MAG: GNAT family N-acetyltransferase [Actinomycetota bacterium]RIK05171.1 MAG: GNAT family N-acetyltransferase [Acidobacteriota bacterium]
MGLRGRGDGRVSEITEATEVTPELIEAFERLVPQLSKSGKPPSEAELAGIVTSRATVLFLARDDEHDGRIVGALTLALFRIPTGLRAWIEDVIVDESCRGKGIGEALNRAAIKRAEQAGARTIDLTSRPNREAANRLYRRMGFEQRESFVYRYNPEKDPGVRDA